MSVADDSSLELGSDAPLPKPATPECSFAVQLGACYRDLASKAVGCA
jgi:hypothetical protein